MDDAPTPASTLGELSTLLTQLEELSSRITRVADAYQNTPDSQVASDLFAAERSLLSARRSLDRATSTVSGR